MRFLDAVKLRTTGCKKCFTATYELPCCIDVSIVSYLSKFGKPSYNLNIVKLLKITDKNGLKIEGKLNTKVIKLSFPKTKIENIHLNPIKISFEKALAAWVSNILGIEII